MWMRFATCASWCRWGVGSLRPIPPSGGGVGATDVRVITKETSVVRTASHINALIGEARLPERVADRALAIFDGLARAEGKLHRRPPEQVHFHEVGGLDAIIDVVGTCAALEVLGHRRGPLQRGGVRAGDDPQRPRALAQPATRGGGAAGGVSHLRVGRGVGADHADRGRPFFRPWRRGGVRCRR